jgi:hypothetical protein
MAGFRVRLVLTSEVFAVPGWWHMAAHRHHAALTRGVRGPHSLREGRGEPAPRPCSERPRPSPPGARTASSSG